jgi:uncharacterized membrane-anchored protein YjiN (DUF445 family)
MKFVVEVEDFWLEEEDLATGLQNAIKGEVIQRIREDIKKQVDAFMDKHIKEVLNEEIKVRVEVLMTDFLAKGKVKGSYTNDPECTVNEWIAKSFKSANETITKYISTATTQQVNELKQRYDLLFASQIVSKLNGQGMLKEDIANILLGEGK